MASRRGRRSKPHKMKDGTVILGLYHRPDGRWRDVETGKIFSADDENDAVRKFRKMQSVRQPQDVVVSAEYEGNPNAANVAEFLNSIEADLEFDDDWEINGNKVVFKIPCKPHVLWPWLAKMLIEQPEYIAKQTGVAEVAGLRHLNIPGESLKLSVIVDTYQKSNPSSDETKKRALAAFKTLTDHAGATRLSDLTTEKLNVYRSHIEATITEPGTRRFYYSKVKAVVAFGLKVGLDAIQIRQTLDRMRVLWTTGNTHVDPKPITRENWDKLLAAAKGTPWEVWLLTALNCCLSIKETCHLTWDAINVNQATFATIRNKSKKEKVPRAAVLWPETVVALKTLLPQKGPYVFTSKRGTKFNLRSRLNEFAKFRERAGVSDAVPFGGLRDGAYTVAAQNSPDERMARILAGHRAAGYQDHYVLRNPSIVKPACDAVYKAYMAPAVAT